MAALTFEHDLKLNITKIKILIVNLIIIKIFKFKPNQNRQWMYCFNYRTSRNNIINWKICLSITTSAWASSCCWWRQRLFFNLDCLVSDWTRREDGALVPDRWTEDDLFVGEFDLTGELLADLDESYGWYRMFDLFFGGMLDLFIFLFLICIKINRKKIIKTSV